MLRIKDQSVKHLLPLLLLLPATSHTMTRYRHHAAMAIIESLAHHTLPSEMNITAEMKIPQTNGAKSVSRFIYLKQHCCDLVPVPGGLIAGHQNTQRYDLEIQFVHTDEVDNAVFTYTAHKDNQKSSRGLLRIPFHESSTERYQLSIKDEYNNPIYLTITSIIKK